MKFLDIIRFFTKKGKRNETQHIFKGISDNFANLFVGGGILGVNATELSTICPNPTTNTRCQISSSKSLITNNGTFNLKGEVSYEKGIYVQQNVDSFINYGEIITHDKDQKIGTYSFALSTNVVIKTLTNYGTISGGISANSGDSTQVYMQINNYGIMSGVSTETYHTFTINNMGIINIIEKKFHFKNGNLVLKKYAITISEKASVFNVFNGQNATDNSHLILDSVKSVSFADKHSKLILDFGNGFEFGTGYLFDKLVVDTSGTNQLNVGFDRLIPRSDIYHITQQGDKFVVHLKPEHSAIGNLYKSNIRTMNNFYTMSNSMIFPRKSHRSQNLGRTHSLLQHSPSLAEGARGWVEYPLLRDSANLNISSLRASARERGNPFALSSLRDLPTANRGNPPIKESIDSALDFTLDSALDSANPLKSYESFAYRSESQNRRIQRQNKRSYSRQPRNLSQNLNTDSANKTNKTNKNNLLDSANHDYYFILTPFINYNSFAKSGNYNLSGFDYGFLTAFSATIAESNHLGTHFIMSYGNLGDSTDKNFNITNLNLNVGLNYKFDMIWDMYIKARGDFYYFLNQVSSASVAKTNADNMGFGASVSYGKDFDFKEGGVLGIEVGIDYKALRTNDVSVKSALDNANMQDYKKSLVNLIYADLGANYAKYFGGFGINVGLGFRANLAPKLAKTQLIIANNTLNVLIDNDKFLGYANAGISYVLNKRDFDMEFSLAYYGNYGDRGVSNGGGFEWRVNF